MMILRFLWLVYAYQLVFMNCELDGWESLGCWRDLPIRALATIEGKSHLLDKNWRQRSNPLEKCANAALEKQYKVFAVQDGGQCFGGPYAQLFFDQYGPSNLCKNGSGGTWSSDVYSSKTAYQRVLQEEKVDLQKTKCSKPLDLVFLVDGSGEVNTENKLRWSEMLRFISKATEEFDQGVTRFSVIKYGSTPKVVVNLTQDSDMLTLRDRILSEKFPGGPRTINDALKTAWKDQFKSNGRRADRVILAFTTGNLPYGPWGSSLFLTNRNVRVMAFGIDKAPSYKFLESLASGKHPENIYSLDTEQFDKALTFIAKDICAGSKRQRIEKTEKGEEMNLFQNDEFETVGTAVERELKTQESKHNETKHSSDAKHVSSNNNSSYKKETAEEEHVKSDQINEVTVNKTFTVVRDSNATDDAVHPDRVASMESNTLATEETPIVEKVNEITENDLPNEHHDASKKTTSSDSEGDLMNDGDSRVSKKNKTNSQADYRNSLKPAQNVSEVLNDTSASQKEHDHGKTESFQETKPIEVDEDNLKREHPKDVGSRDDSKDDEFANNLVVGPSVERTANESTNETKQTPDTVDGDLLSRGQTRSSAGASINATDSAIDNKQLKHKSTKPVYELKFLGKMKLDDVKQKLHDSSSTVSKVNDSSTRAKPLLAHSFVNTEKPSTRDIDRDIFSRIQEERNSFGEDDRDSLFTLTDKDSTERKLHSDVAGKSESEDKSIDGTTLEDNTMSLSTDDPYDALTGTDEYKTRQALEQKRKEIDILLKKLDEKKHRKRRRRKRKTHSSKHVVISGVRDDDNSDNERPVAMKKHAQSQAFHVINETGRVDMKNEMKHGQGDLALFPEDELEVSGKDNTDKKDDWVFARHFHRISQNDSKPYPVQRPALPTTRALKLFNKLYKTTPSKNQTLNYDIFEPAYSPTKLNDVTETNFDTFVRRIKSESAIEHDDHTSMTERPQKLTHIESSQPFDEQRFFLRHNINHNAQLSAHRLPLHDGIPQVSRYGTRNRNDKSQDRKTDVYSYRKNDNDVNPTPPDENLYLDQPISKSLASSNIDNHESGRIKVESPKSRTIHDDKTEKPVAENLSNFKLQSLSDVDSGSYTIHKVANNNILVTLKSKSGELKTFYGTTDMSDKGNQVSKSSYHNHGTEAIANSTSAHHTKVKTDGESTKHKVRNNTKSSSHVNNRKVSTLLTRNATRGRKELGHEKQKKAPSLDFYNENLSKADKPISYFEKPKSRERLIITENSDPVTDSSMIKLFVNSGTDDSMMSPRSHQLESRETKSDFKHFVKKFGEYGEISDVRHETKKNSSKDTSNKKQTEAVNQKDVNTNKNVFLTKQADKRVKNESKDDPTQDREDIEEFSITGNGKIHVVTSKPEKNEAQKHEVSSADNKIDRADHQSEQADNSSLRSKPVDSKTGRTDVLNKSSDAKLAENATHQREIKDDVWIFKPDQENSHANESTNASMNHEKDNKERPSSQLGAKSIETGSKNEQFEKETSSNRDSFSNQSIKAPKEQTQLSKLGDAMGCARPIKVLFAIDVSDAIGTGPSRKTKWQHLKRFLNSVKGRTAHGSSLGYIVYDNEPRFLSDLEPCDEATEYFVTSGDCLCDHHSSSYRAGRSTCSTHSPNDDESLEDWGAEGPRTGLALEMARKLFHNDASSNAKKLIVLLTHQASTDDVTTVEKELKDDSISLVDIEIGERHNLRKRSNNFGDVIPRDHRMEVSFYKLDRAIEKIITKICNDKSNSKSRRSHIYATMRRPGT